MTLTAREIIRSYSQGRQFYVTPTAEELLVGAYNEMREQLRTAEERVRVAEERLASTVDHIATQCLNYAPEVFPTPQDPTRWRLRLDPILAETRMLTANPAKWDPAVLDAVSKEIAALAHSLVAGTLYAMRKTKAAA